MPLFWSFGSANALPAILTHGGTIVLQESFEPGEALELLDRERCSVYYGMANMARAIPSTPTAARRALAAMRTGLTIGLPEDVEMTMEAVSARELCNVYGATETYGNCAVTDAHDARELRLTTQGWPLPGMEIRVVDPATGRALAAGEVGEFRVKGHVTPGYYRDPEQTRAAFDDAGFFVTGRPRTAGRRRARALPRPAEGNDQDRRRQRRAAGGGGHPARTSGREASLRGRHCPIAPAARWAWPPSSCTRAPTRRRIR